MAVVLGLCATFFFDGGHRVLLSLSLGAIGGLIHEMVQSGGKILFFERKMDGFYIGGITGTMLGAIAGLLMVHGLAGESTMSEIGYQTFLAGLGLKGLVDAASGQPVPEGAKSVTPLQALAGNQAINASLQPQTVGFVNLPPPPARVPQL
jgi:hypothetical protein